MVVGSADSLVSVWDMSELACVYTVSRYDAPVKGLSFNGDGSMVAVTVEGSPVVDVFDSSNGESVTTIDTGATMVNSIAWSADRNLLAIALDTQGGGAGTAGAPGGRGQRSEGEYMHIAVVTRS